MFFSLIGSIHSALYKPVRAFGDLDGVGLQFRSSPPMWSNEIFNLVVKQNNQRLHMGLDHAELVSDGLGG